jgi:hypothetical protein
MSALCAGLHRGEIGIAVGIEEAVHDVLPAVRGQVDRQAFLPEDLLDALQKPFEIGVFGVDLVDEDHAAEAAFARRSHHPRRVELDAVLRVDDDDRRLHRRKRRDRLAGEIRHAGRIDQVDVDAFVGEVDERRIERVAVLLFEGVEVGDGGASLQAAHRADGSGFPQQGVGQQGLARPAVAH